MRKEIIREFYIMALIDIVHGGAIADLEAELELYEREELYEECAGIKKALEIAETKTIKELKKIIFENEIRNNT